MPVRPLDLQVNINTVLETSRAQSVKQALAAQQQRNIDDKSVEDAKNREKMVNQSEKPETQEKLSDKEKHFAKTEPEIENEEAGTKKRDQKERSPQKKDQNSKESKEPSPAEDDHIDYLA